MRFLFALLVLSLLCVVGCARVPKDHVRPIQQDLESGHIGQAVWKPCTLNLKYGLVHCKCPMTGDGITLEMVYNAKTGETILSCAKPETIANVTH